MDFDHKEGDRIDLSDLVDMTKNTRLDTEAVDLPWKRR